MTSLGVRPNLSQPLLEESSVFPINSFWFLRKPPITEVAHPSTTIGGQGVELSLCTMATGSSVLGGPESEPEGGALSFQLDPLRLCELQEVVSKQSVWKRSQQTSYEKSQTGQIGTISGFLVHIQPVAHSSPLCFLQPFKNVKTLLRRQAIKHRPAGCGLPAPALEHDDALSNPSVTASFPSKASGIPPSCPELASAAQAL